MWCDGTVGRRPSRPSARGRRRTYANRGRPHPPIRAVRVGPESMNHPTKTNTFPSNHQDEKVCDSKKKKKKNETGSRPNDLERTLSSSTVKDCHSSSNPSCSPCVLTNSPTLTCCKGIGDSWTRSWAWVDFPVPGVPVMTMTGERLTISRKSESSSLALISG